MQTIGLIGGMSWESSIEYYRLINEIVRERVGGLHSARSVMVSVDFAEIEEMQHAGRWEEAGRVLSKVAHQVEQGGADCVVLCTNTMHKVAGPIQAAISVPFLHIADATAEAIQEAGLHTIGLLGTRFTMEAAFYKGRLVNQHGLDVRVPPAADRQMVNQIIYDELCLGVIKPSSKSVYLDIIARLVEAGAEGIILGCTEIGLLVKAADTDIPLFDTTYLHAAAAVDFALQDG